MCFFFQICDSSKDPVLLSFKGKIYLQKGLIDQALEVQSYLVKVIEYWHSAHIKWSSQSQHIPVNAIGHKAAT